MAGSNSSWLWETDLVVIPVSIDVMVSLIALFFFFQAEDGIRDIGVTGVQTCALPISRGLGSHLEPDGHLPGVQQAGQSRPQDARGRQEAPGLPEVPGNAGSKVGRARPDRKSVV